MPSTSDSCIHIVALFDPFSILRDKIVVTILGLDCVRMRLNFVERMRETVGHFNSRRQKCLLM